MSPGAKFFLGMMLVPMIVVPAFVVSRITFYVPSGLLADAAERERYSSDARAEMARLLRYCRKHGDTHFKARDIGVAYRSITSWRNDAGWLARTAIECADGEACTVRAKALIAAPRASAPCSWLNPRLN
ncbi:hypothetical protein FHS95_002717 [Sphingomonas naasensis]|uniref:Uncharacterized protein n=1 Tax=Sphingomonas naasensis TaxID=1344951 RepID=A0A4V6RB32_9SPHN|nr:hypothetical protein [Sphingomonas naasensis]NIJ21025.1 hypothetical protein [Sphingomonas naasensis]TGX43402.1 hypothetical protein E5A74_09610 [Sphingomonas naasensis]